MGAMELEEKTVQIRDDFDPDKILESGQCFRPRKQAEGWYRFVSGRQLLYLRPLRSGTYTVRCEPGAWETFWHGYFDLGRSYAALRGKLDSRDDFLQRAMEYGRGIRVCVRMSGRCWSASSSRSERASRLSRRAVGAAFGAVWRAAGQR